MIYVGSYGEGKDTVTIDMSQVEARQLYATLSLSFSVENIPESNKALARNLMAQISDSLDE